MAAKYLIIIAGPTAIGKTDLAIRLAEYYNTEILSADSRQIYRETVIGTAVPAPAQLARVKHHFIGHKSIHDYYNASHFETEAIGLLGKLFVSQDVVIMAGGSGMYLDAVCQGIDDIPTVDPVIRDLLRKEYQSVGLAGICSRLQEVDPVYYEKVDLHNPIRILKALEIHAMTGLPYSSFLTGKSRKREFSPLKIGLDMPRKELHDRINIRVENMMALGLLKETEALFQFRKLNALNTMGYKEMFDYLEGKYSLKEAVELIKGHTRQYARRQLTWFRKYEDIQWFNPGDTENLIRYLNSIIRHR
jgi:tRNA dimethylallyltransferase